MAEDLWKLRQKRGLSAQQLAVRSGVPLLSIQEYEQGKTVRAADLSRLAKALFVDEFDIKLTSEPFRPPKTATEDKPKSFLPNRPKTQPDSSEVTPVRPTKPFSRPRIVPLARPGQIQHLLQLAAVLQEDEPALIVAIGKPLQQLTVPEIQQYLRDYNDKVKQNKVSEGENRPPHTRRKRAHLPEGLDEFELNYLQSHYQAQNEMSFTLLNGQSFTGRIIGFTPYFITISETTGREVTMQKLALAYYTTTKQQETA